MEWKKWYLDLILVPSAVMIYIVYHIWLWHTVRTQPLQTVIGTNARGRRFWVSSIIKDNDNRSVVAVHTMGNTILSCNLMASTSVILCTALAAVVSTTNDIRKPIAFGAHDEVAVALKYVTLLVFFLCSFICNALSVRFFNQVNFLVNCITETSNDVVTEEYVVEMLQRGFLLSLVGNRVFYSAVPMLLWIFGPVLVFLCSVMMVPLLYNLDVIVLPGEEDKEKEDEQLERGVR